MIREGPSRQSWCQQVAQYLLGRVDAAEQVLLVSDEPGARVEMLKLAESPPNDVIAEIHADPIDPRRTYLELRLAPLPIPLDSGLRIVYSDEAGGQ